MYTKMFEAWGSVVDGHGIEKHASPNKQKTM